MQTRTALVVYESMFGGTERIARAVANGMQHLLDVRVGSVEQISAADVATADLLVLGGPTHAHGMSLPATRAEAIAWTHDVERGLELAPGTHNIGVREWIDELTAVPRFAAFDTRASIPRLLSGAASLAIARGLAKHGGTSIAEPESFLVDNKNSLADNEVARAIIWGGTLAGTLLEQPPIS